MLGNTQRNRQNHPNNNSAPARRSDIFGSPGHDCPLCYNSPGNQFTILLIGYLFNLMHVMIPDEFLERVAEKFRMLGDPTRLSILRALLAGEKNVGSVVAETGQNQANVSKHLKLLAEAGMVGRRKEGLQVFYSVGDPLIEKLCELVCGTVIEETQAAVDRNRKLLKSWHGQSSAASRSRG